MNETARATGRIGSLDELLAIAHAMEQEAAIGYRALSALMHRQGDPALATQFEALATMEERHAADVEVRSQRLLSRKPNSADVRWVLPVNLGKEEAHGAPLNPYQALASAVRNEERAFAFYTYLAAETEQPDIRALAEALARDELEHAAILRHHRRRAFHADRPVPVEIPETVDALRGMARRWDAEAASAHAALAAELDAVGETGDAAIFRVLSDRESATANASAVDTALVLRDAADGLRLLERAFDRYALIAERANDETVVAEAQRLAGEIVARLALAEGARRNPLPGA